MSTLDGWDQQATLALNSLHVPGWDHFWMLMSDRWVWIPFYIVLIYIIFRRLGWKRGLVLVGAVIVAFIISDRISTLVKFGVGRLRPCYTTCLLESGLRTSESRGGFFGFFSAHASNAFMLIACIVTGLRADKSRSHNDIAALGYTWAALVAFSRVMVGKHFLGDILVGTAFGLLLGWALGLLARYCFRRLEPGAATCR